jgi:HEAT repeat protein
LRRIDPKALPRPSPAARFVPAEVATLEGRDLGAGFAAMERLTRIGPEAVEAMPEILRFCDRCRKDPTQNAMNGLILAAWVTRANFGDGLIPALLAEIRDDRPETACLAAIFIGNGRVENADAIPKLAALLVRTRGKVKASVAEALGSVGRADPRVVSWLVRALKDPDPRARLGAVEGLMLQERPPQEALDAVEAAKQDADPKVRGMAGVALEILKTSRRVAKSLDPARDDD